MGMHTRRHTPAYKELQGAQAQPACQPSTRPRASVGEAQAAEGALVSLTLCALPAACSMN